MHFETDYTNFSVKISRAILFRLQIKVDVNTQYITHDNVNRDDVTEEVYLKFFDAKKHDKPEPIDDSEVPDDVPTNPVENEGSTDQESKDGQDSQESDDGQDSQDSQDGDDSTETQSGDGEEGDGEEGDEQGEQGAGEPTNADESTETGSGRSAVRPPITTATTYTLNRCTTARQKSKRKPRKKITQRFSERLSKLSRARRCKGRRLATYSKARVIGESRT